MKRPAQQPAFFFAAFCGAKVHPAFTKQSPRNRQYAGTSGNFFRCWRGQCRNTWGDIQWV